MTESIGETGVCVADQPPAHGDHDLLTLIVSMTARNHQTDSYKSVHKSVQHVVCNQFNSSWGCAATAVWGWSVERLLLVHCIYYDGGSRVRGTPADRHKCRKFPIIADRRRSLFAPCVNRTFSKYHEAIRWPNLVIIFLYVDTKIKSIKTETVEIEWKW